LLIILRRGWTWCGCGCGVGECEDINDFQSEPRCWFESTCTIDLVSWRALRERSCTMIMGCRYIKDPKLKVSFAPVGCLRRAYKVEI
jgi:hypothetical protein